MPDPVSYPQVSPSWKTLFSAPHEEPSTTMLFFTPNPHERPSTSLANPQELWLSRISQLSGVGCLNKLSESGDGSLRSQGTVLSVLFHCHILFCLLTWNWYFGHRSVPWPLYSVFNTGNLQPNGYELFLICKFILSAYILKVNMVIV